MPSKEIIRAGVEMTGVTTLAEIYASVTATVRGQAARAALTKSTKDAPRIARMRFRKRPTRRQRRTSSDRPQDDTGALRKSLTNTRAIMYPRKARGRGVSADAFVVMTGVNKAARGTKAIRRRMAEKAVRKRYAGPVQPKRYHHLVEKGHRNGAGPKMYIESVWHRMRHSQPEDLQRLMSVELTKVINKRLTAAKTAQTPEQANKALNRIFTRIPW